MFWAIPGPNVPTLPLAHCKMGASPLARAHAMEPPPPRGAIGGNICARGDRRGPLHLANARAMHSPCDGGTLGTRPPLCNLLAGGLGTRGAGAGGDVLGGHPPKTPPKPKGANLAPGVLRMSPEICPRACAKAHPSGRQFRGALLIGGLGPQSVPGKPAGIRVESMKGPPFDLWSCGSHSPAPAWEGKKGQKMWALTAMCAVRGPLGLCPQRKCCGDNCWR